MQICPDLSYFKKSRDLETSLERTFYQNLMNEFEDETMALRADNSNILNDSVNSSMHFNDNDNDNISSYSNRTSSIEQSPQFDDNMLKIGTEANSQGAFANFSGFFEGFSTLNSEEIKEYIHQFGDGSRNILKAMPNYKTFNKAFIVDNKSTFGGSDNKPKKVKKETMLFTFEEETEVVKKEVFDKESKTKKANKEVAVKERKKRK